MFLQQNGKEDIKMPLLFYKHPAPGTSFGLWHITEDEAFFREDLPLSSEEEQEFAQFKGIRRMEWLAGRWLLHKLTGEEHRLAMGKNTFAKPFFIHHPEKHCSLSHSHGIVGAFLSDHVCGCDVQVLVKKIEKIAHKFIGKEEQAFLDSIPEAYQFDLLHIFWTAKESLYKTYGLKELDFREHLYLEPFEWNGKTGKTIGRIEKNDFQQRYELVFTKYQSEDAPDLIWTICQEMG